jgi:pimeloyl-ACP methyl ester carboxylesterase
MANIINLRYEGNPINISYDLQRRGEESIVFIHGLGCCKDCFRDVWGFPGYKQYTVLTFDLPGFGDSDKPYEFSYRMEDQASITKLLIQELNLSGIHIVGHSMGGAIGLLLTKDIKSIVDSFICLEGNFISEDCTGSRNAVKYSLEDFLKEGFNHLKADISESADELFLDCLSKSDPYAFYRSSESLVKWSDNGKLLELFLSLDICKYYIFGELNASAPVIKYLTSIPKLMIPNAGHAMMADNPSRFYSDLLGIL